MERRFEQLADLGAKLPNILHRTPEIDPRQILTLYRGSQLAEIPYTALDLPLDELATVDIQYGDTDEVVELLCSSPQPSIFDTEPKTIDWNDDVNVSPAESAIFKNYDLSVSSAPKDKRLEIEFIAEARDSIADSFATRMKLAAIRRKAKQGLFTYDGEPLHAIEHFPDGKGIGFNIKLDSTTSISLEFCSRYDDESERDLTDLMISFTMKGSKDPDETYEDQVRMTLERTRAIIPNLVGFFSAALTDSEPDKVKLEMPIQRLRNQQSGINRIDSVEAPKFLSGNSDTELFKSIARNPTQYGLEMIGGLAEPVSMIRDAVDIVGHAKMFKERNIGTGSGILLWGPPGTGKSMLAAVAASEMGGYFLKIDCSDILNKWVGESEARVRQIFKLVHTLAKHGPVTIFFDEFDTLGRAKGPSTPEWMRNITNTFLTSMNDIPDNCLLIAAVNDKESLEPAIRRDGRMTEISVPLPDVSGRVAILTNWINHFNTSPAGICFSPDINIQRLATATTNSSGAELYDLLEKTFKRKILDAIRSETEPGQVTTEDVLRYLQIKRSVKLGSEGQTGQYL